MPCPLSEFFEAPDAVSSQLGCSQESGETGYGFDVAEAGKDAKNWLKKK